MRTGQLATLDKMRTDTLNSGAITMQRYARGFLARRRYARTLAAVLRLQACVRGMLARRLVADLRARKAALVIQVRH